MRRAAVKQSEGNSRKFPSHLRRTGTPKSYAKTFFEENFRGRTILLRAARHILQQSQVKYDQDGIMLPLTAPKEYWIVESLLCDLEKDFEMAKMLSAAKKGGAA